METRIVPTPYPTIQEAINAAESGDRVIVLGGIYKENLIINTEGITIEGVNPDLAIIQGECNGNGVTILADNFKISHMIIENFEVGIYSDADSTIVESCIVKKNKIAAFVLYDTSHNIKNNQIINNTIGITLNAIRCNITSNVFKKNESVCIQNVEDVIYECMIKYNYFSDSETALIFTDSASYLNEVQDNVIIKCDQGIVLNAFNNSIIENSISYCNIVGIDIKGNLNNIKLNNISNNTQGLIVSGKENIVEKNNIIQNINFGLVVSNSEVSNVNQFNENIIINNTYGVSLLNGVSINNSNIIKDNERTNIMPSQCNLGIECYICSRDPSLYMNKFLPDFSNNRNKSCI